MAALQRHRDLNYKRWIKLLKGLYMVKDVLCPHVEDVLKDFHQNELIAAFGVYRCDTLTPVWNKTTHTWSLSGGPACIHRCADWLNRIAAEHVQYPSSRKDMFKLCDLTQLSTCPWEVAKAYLADNLKAQSTKAPAELDPYYLLRMIKDCTLFTSIQAKVEKVHQTRNELAHAAKQGINTDREVEESMNEMIDLVKLLPKAPASTSGDLEKVRDGKLEEVSQELSQRDMEIVRLFTQDQQLDILGDRMDEGGARIMDEVQDVQQRVEEGNILHLLEGIMIVGEIKDVGQKMEGGGARIMGQVQEVGQRMEEGGARIMGEMEKLRRVMEGQSSEKGRGSHRDDSPQDDTQRLREELAETYLQHYSNLQPVPWSAEVSLPINLVYQEQTLTGKAGASKQHGGSSELKSILELWGEEQYKPGTILIEAPAGMGKSTLCQQLIQAWALRVNASASQPAAAESASPDDLNSSRLHQYQLVLFIRVRELSDGQLTRNLQENLVRNCWEDNDLKKCVSKNIEQVLLIVDGYDEGDEAQKRCVDRWLKGTDCRGCTLIVTSRPGFCRPKAQPEQNPNRTYTLMGLDRAKQQDFARKFDQAMGVEPGKRSASEQLQQFQDRDFLQTPLLLALVCVLASQGQGALPKNVSGLYDEFTEFLSLKAMRGPIHFSNDYVAELVKFLQEIAFKLFKLKKSEITTGELITHVLESEVATTMDNLCKLGLIQQEIKLKGWKNSQTGAFIHQSFLDYFAARYFVYMCKDERSTLLEGMEMHENMLVLAAGLCGESGEQHRECFGQMLEAWDRAVQRVVKEKWGECDHSVCHACFMWLSELRDPCWLHAYHINAIYQTCDKTSRGEGICLDEDCTASCWTEVTALLEAAHHHTLHGARHALCDPATFKLDVCPSDADISPAAKLDLLDAALRYNTQLTCEELVLHDCLTPVQCDHLRAVLTRLNHLEGLAITVSSWATTNIVLQGLNSTSLLERLYVTCSPSSPRDPPLAAAGAAAEDSWSPHEFIDNISVFSTLGEIVLTDEESTLSTEHRIEITRRLSDRRPRVEVEIWDRDSQTGEETRWEMDSEADVDTRYIRLRHQLTVGLLTLMQDKDGELKILDTDSQTGEETTWVDLDISHLCDAETDA